MRKPRVLLADDHALLLDAFTRILEPEYEVVGRAPDGRSVVAAARQLQPELVLLDISMPGVNGLEAIPRIRALNNPPAILVLSMHDEALYAERALRAGAQGYVMKDAPPEVIVRAVRSVLQGNIHVSSEITSRLLGRIVSRPGVGAHAPCFSRLSDRELEVFQAIGEGRTTIQIARALKLSVKTIETYRTNIKEKLGLKSGLELVRQAMRWAEDEGKGRPVAKKKPRRR